MTESNLVDIKVHRIVKLCSKGYTLEELEGLSLIELRDLMDKEFPRYATVCTATSSGGTQTKTIYFQPKGRAA